MLIRPVQIQDTKAILDIYAPYILNSAFTFETTVPSEQEFAERINTYTQKYPWLIAEDDGKIIGYAYAGKHRDREAYQWCVESSVYVLDEYHGKGIAHHLYNRLFELLKQFGYINVYAAITLPNSKSISFHTKMGFEHFTTFKNIGYKLGKWHDVAWMVKVINEHADDPGAPKKVQ